MPLLEPCCLLCTCVQNLTRVSNPVQSIVVNRKVETHHPLFDGQVTKAGASLNLSEDGQSGWPRRGGLVTEQETRWTRWFIPRLSLAEPTVWPTLSSSFYLSLLPPFFPHRPPPPMDPIHLDGSSTSGPYDQIEIDDDEEDQLASDIDEQQPPATPPPDGEELEPDPDDEDAREGGQPQSSTTPNGKRKHQRKTGERVPGHTLLPTTRLENILRADGMRPRRISSRPPSSQFL